MCHTVLPLLPRKGLVANPFCGFAYGNPAGLPQAGRGIGAESPVFCEAKNAPKIKKVPLNLYQDYVKFGIFPKSELLAGGGRACE
jgi:hypothetical protein